MIKRSKIILLSIAFIALVTTIIVLGLQGKLTSKLPKWAQIGDNPLSIFSKRQAASEEILDFKKIPVSCITVTTEKVLPEFHTSGIIEPVTKIEIFPKIQARIHKLTALEGELVKSGQLIVSMEKEPIQLELQKQELMVESALSQAKLSEEKYFKARRNIEGKFKEVDKQKAVISRNSAEVDRVEGILRKKEILLQQGGATQEEIENLRTELQVKTATVQVSKKELEILEIGLRKEDLAKNGFKVPQDSTEFQKEIVDLNTGVEKAELNSVRMSYQSAKKSLESAKLLLRETDIYSPLTGIVSKRFKSEGELVGPNGSQSILTLMAIDRVYATINVSETDSPSLRPGANLSFSADLFPGIKFSGTIKIISPVFDSKTHTAEIKALIDNKSKKLLPGMFIRAKVSLGDEKTIIALPESAILPSEGKSAFIFVINNNIAFKIPVTLGERYGEKIEIKSGLKGGETVAIEKVSLLREGLEIQADVKGNVTNEPKKN